MTKYLSMNYHHHGYTISGPQSHFPCCPWVPFCTVWQQSSARSISLKRQLSGVPPHKDAPIIKQTLRFTSKNVAVKKINLVLFFKFHLAVPILFWTCLLGMLASSFSILQRRTSAEKHLESLCIKPFLARSSLKATEGQTSWMISSVCQVWQGNTTAWMRLCLFVSLVAQPWILLSHASEHSRPEMSLKIVGKFLSVLQLQRWRLQT